MGSYTPRHLKQERAALPARLSRKGVMVVAAAGFTVPSFVGQSASANSDLGPQPTSVATVASSGATGEGVQVDLGYGSSGPLVEALQTRLNDRGYGLAVDGDFGPATLAAVQQFQGAHGLGVSGRTSADTWEALGGIPSGPSTTAGTTDGGSTPEPVSYTAGSSDIVDIARSLTGVPYVWGGATPSGFDCSGFTQYVYSKAGISIPRTASAQQAAATPVSTPRPGDLVFSGSPAYHVGIYLGDGQMLASSKPGELTGVKPLWNVSGYGRF